MRRIWVTRTQPRADATAARVRAMGFEPIVAPLLTARALSVADLDLTDVEALAFTSEAGVRAFAAASPSRDRPVFAVGETTARAARAAGFSVALTSAGDVQALADAIAEARPGLVLNPGAREPAADLAALLVGRGLAARTLAVYETVPTEIEAPADIDALLIHSPRAARIVAALISPEQAAALSAFAISEAAAAPLRVLPFARILVAAFPDEASLLDLLQG